MNVKWIYMIFNRKPASSTAGIPEGGGAKESDDLPALTKNVGVFFESHERRFSSAELALACEESHKRGRLYQFAKPTWGAETEYRWTIEHAKSAISYFRREQNRIARKSATRKPRALQNDTPTTTEEIQ